MKCSGWLYYAWKDPNRHPSDTRPVIVGCRKRYPVIVGCRNRCRVIDRVSAGDRSVSGRCHSIHHAMIVEITYRISIIKICPLIGQCHRSSQENRSVFVRFVSDWCPMLQHRNEIKIIELSVSFIHAIGRDQWCLFSPLRSSGNRPMPERFSWIFSNCSP